MRVPTFKNVARLLTPLKNIAGRVHHDQKGTSLTEFVICLPIFIIIFVGVVNLNKLQDKSVLIKVQATNDLWTNAIPVQKENIASRMVPLTQGGNTVAHIGSRLKYPISDAIGIAGGLGLGATGHFGESYAMTIGVSAAADVFTSDMEIEMRGGPVYNDMELTRDLVDDGTIKTIPNGSGALSYLNMLITISGTRPAIAAGIRYGLASGEAKATVSIAGVSNELSTGYDVLVAPKPTSEALTVAVTRLAVESYKPFNGILGIEWSGRL